MLQEIIHRLLDEATGGLKHDVEVYADRIIRRMLKTLVLGGLGVTLLSAGCIFFLIGTVTYLSTFMFGGLAWGIVGVAVALFGGVLLLLIRR
jgi:hypothetical protein